ncbi:DHHC palmitoyltransferase-domain-containing protein [Lophiotrema nucula]|uniref:Palmitoyltransferase PFA4 n=1 Tax=Lophiotrema nucula TaxID=690887 RepID=A0A6A5ZGX8_9PLEO|nr:DHHC palmitoyltransferase-domain-containing protein [Lophiotrema nucula]
MELSSLVVPSVYALIFFLAYSSQALFLYLEPHPLERHQLIRFNLLLVCLLICYTRSVNADPGRIPKQKQNDDKDENENEIVQNGKQIRQRWCRKCEAVKPPRAHHCKECKRCVPKMDHHCPWTSNCVSHTTFPHFLRFLFYAVASMLYLAHLLWIRCAIVWENRNLPAYLGPSMFQLGHLFLLLVTNSLTLFVLTILFVRNVWCLAVNTTTIEGWEIERHRTLVRRARVFGGYLDGPDGAKVRIKKQEFPYDIGIWANFKQGMGTSNIFAWFWPLAASPPVETGIEFETNGFENADVTWPPLDPDRLTRKFPKGFDKAEEAFTYRDDGLNDEDTMAAFKARQDADLIRRRKPFADRIEAKLAQERNAPREDGSGSDAYDESEEEAEERGSRSGEEGWKNSEGERLRDFGVDEDVEFYDEEDDLPLSELLARHKAKAAQ